MNEKRTGPRKGGSRTFNVDGTEVFPAAAPVAKPKPKPKTESAPQAAKKKNKE